MNYKIKKEENHKNQIVRNDTGVKEGDEISIYYDPMIAKLSTWGKTRDEAIRLMLFALDQFMIQGVRNNLSFLSVVMSNKDFKDGNISTSFIEQNFSKGFKEFHLKSIKK